MFLTLFAICLVLLLLFILQLFKWPSLRTYWLLSKLPGPKGKPLIGMGHVFSKFKQEDFLPFIRDLTKKYPRITVVWILGTPQVYMTKVEDLEVVMSSMTHITKGANYKSLRPWLGEGLLLSTGQKWHKRRKMLTPAFHFRILETSLQTFNKNSAFLAQKLMNTKEPVDIESEIRLCTLDAICDSAMGVPLNSQMEKGMKYVKSIYRISEIIKTRSYSLWLQRAWMFYLHPIGVEFKKLLKILHGFTDKVIEERKKLYIDKILQPDDGNKTKSKSRKAFLDTLIEYEIKNPGSLSKHDIREEVDTFMFEGHDTTSSALTFTLFLLGVHQDVQDRVVAELYDIFGDSDRACELKDLQQMTYLEMVIKESLRLYPSVPLIARYLTKDLKLDGDVVIPSGANLYILPFLIHRNEEYYPDPDRFDPERFAEDECAKRHPYAFIPFSAGPRNCIGQKFAFMEMKVVISTLLRRTKIESITQRGDFKLLSLLIIRPTIPIMLKFTPRESMT